MLSLRPTQLAVGIYQVITAAGEHCNQMACCRCVGCEHRCWRMLFNPSVRIDFPEASSGCMRTTEKAFAGRGCSVGNQVQALTPWHIGAGAGA